MPLVKIVVTRDGVTRDQKKLLIKGAIELLERVLQKDPKTTFVLIDEVDPDSWGVVGRSVSDLRCEA